MLDAPGGDRLTAYHLFLVPIDFSDHSKIHSKGLEAESILRTGNPYEEIVNAAKQIGADLIVIGSHGYTGLSRLLLGSTADRVLQYAPCPVLVVKDPSIH